MGTLPKVLLLGGSLEGGGAERRFFNLARTLFGGSSRVIVLSQPGTASRAALPNVETLGWKSELSYPRMVFQLRRSLTHEPPDVVLSFGRFPILCSWAATRLMHKRPALAFCEVTRPHAALCHAPRALKTQLQRALMRWAYPEADLFLVNSIDGGTEVVDYFGVDSSVVERVPNLIDETTLNAHPDDPGLELTREPFFVSAGRLERLKRLDTLIEAMARNGHGPMKAVILGSGPQRQQLENLAAESGIADRILFAGWLRRPYEVMRRATAYVQCSEYEGFSNAVLEAMALGVPVVTSLCSSDAREMVELGAALGFPAGDTEALAHLLTRLLREPELRDSLVLRARDYCSNHYLDKGIGAYEGAVRRAIMRHQSSSKSTSHSAR